MHVFFTGCALSAPYSHATHIAQGRCIKKNGANLFWIFWIPLMVLRMHVPLHTTGQKQCFWIPLTVLFRMPNAKNYGASQGWRSIRIHLCTQ